MQRAWINDVSAVMTSARVLAAERTAARCSAATPFAARSISDGYDAVRQRVLPLVLRHEMARASAVQVAGAGVFVRCFGPAVAQQDRLLSIRRDAFFAQHADAIRAAEAATSGEVALASARYGLVFGAVRDAGEANPNPA